jgi:hypothetical protein
MSIRVSAAAIIAMCSSLVLSGSAAAQTAAPAAAKPKTVTFTGCPQKSFPEFCVTIKGPKNTTYTITSANPPAPIGKLVRLRGTVNQGPSLCGGIILTDIQWMVLPGACPK